MAGLERDGRAYSVYSDTPITMTRNRAVEDAKAGRLRFPVDARQRQRAGRLLESGRSQLGRREAVLGNVVRLRLSPADLHGIPTVIVAPYCGPPPHPIAKPGWIDGGEVPYLFEWSNNESDNPHAHQKLSMLTRNEAARLSGIHPIAAAPTGVSLWALKVFRGHEAAALLLRVRRMPRATR
jgi:hypothetical protein